MKKHLKQKKSQRIVHRINFKAILYVTTVSSVVVTSFIILQETGIHTTSKAEKGITVSSSSIKDVPFEKGNFKEQQKTFDAVKINIEKGLELLDNDPPLYEDALNLFLEAQEFNPNSSDLNCKIGVCYMNSGTKFEALDYFEKAFALNSKVDSKIHYYLGTANQIQHHFTKAKEEYEKYIKEGAKNKSEIEISNKRISECVTGDFLITHPVKVKIENLGEGVNTQYPEYSPHITADESQIFYTSRRTDTYGGEKNEQDGKYFEDIYMSEKGTDGKWLPAKNLGAPLNTATHDATSGLSPDGHTLFVFKGDVNNGDILVSGLTAQGWSKPESAGKNINSAFHESSASLAPDGKTLYFVSNRQGGMGGRDIYFSKWMEKKKAWGEAVNIGLPINSAYDEEGVWIHPDGKNLYFSSRGNGSMGGYDIFYSAFEDGKWNVPVNLGYPINSADDDVFVEISASGRTLYFASVKKEGKGEKDIYAATYLEETTIKPRVVLYKGRVLDGETHLPLPATIELTDLDINQNIGKFNTDPASGKFLVPLPGGKNYGATIEADRHMFYSDNFNIPHTPAYKAYQKDIYLQPVKQGTSFILNNIFFETAKWNIKDQSINELERLFNLMTVNPALKIEINGFTDNMGNDEANRVLSENRAKAVADYLKKKNIDESRLQFHGYGESRPVATNETAEGRALNRRTEFKVLEN